ncbi:MAG: ABC transporter ATP-binding protein, partial [Tistlia sp.]|uniref:ABC transporter ATP-binding protein n=1 Tax=Tistlia sp. TaxID=3057121 RepID=UPI0034A37D53
MPDTATLRAAAADPAAASLPVNAVEIEHLAKTYRAAGRSASLTALSDVSLAIPRGCVFGLLGPNGAGKSTLINIMAGLVTKTAGSVRIWDNDIDRATRQARASIGVVPQELNIDPFFTPFEMLELQAGLYGVPPRERRTREILAMLGLADKAEAYTRTLSGGMRRRLMVAKAMVHNPPVLVLDEPTAGVDI